MSGASRRSRGGARRRSAGPADLLPPPPPHPRYHVRRREWGTWVAEITDRNTGRRIWLGTFQSAAQAAWRHDVENVQLHGSRCGDLNFPLGCEEPVPELFPPPSRGHATQFTREDREAWERLEAERASEEYMAKLRRLNPERVAEEAAAYAKYTAKRQGGGKASSSSAPVTAAASSSAAESSLSASVVIDLDDGADTDDKIDRWLGYLDD